MKKIFVPFLFLICTMSFGQETKTKEKTAAEAKMTAVERNDLNDNVAVPDFREKDPKAEENKIYIMPDLDVKPSFPGGNDQILVFFNNNFDKKTLKANAWIFVDFIIEKDGSTSISINKSTGTDVETEAKRIFSKMPKFSPGKIGGKVVRSTFSQRFNIIKS